MTRNNNNLSKEEIKYAVREITGEPEEKLIERIQDFFEFYPDILEKLTDAELKEHYIKVSYNYNYLHQEVMREVQETERTGRIILEILLKEKNKKSDQEIKEILESNSWRREAGFFISKDFNVYSGEYTYKLNWRDNSNQNQTLKVEDFRKLLNERAEEKIKEIEAKKQLIEQLALNQTIEEKVIEKFKEKFPQEIEGFLLIKKEFESLKSQLEAAELDAKTHYDAIGVSEIWNKDKEKVLRKEIADKLELLQKKEGDLEKKEVQVKKLEKDLEESLNQFSEKSEKQEEQIKELQRKLYLATKPLPSLPKIQKPSKFKIFKEKTKNKFQHLVEKTKRQSQEFIARIEVKIK